MTAIHNFNEKTEEYSARDGKNIPVWQSPKFIETKKKVIEMIDSGKFVGLNDSHFWILMNRTKSGKMAYTGLIISHDGMKVINDSLPEDKQVKASCFSPPITSEIKKDCMFMYYQDEDTYEFGEISPENCSNAYPYAMLYKRCYDRVVKDKAKMYGVYSESEAEEFKERVDEEESLFDLMRRLYTKQEIANIVAHYELGSIEELDVEKAIKYVNDRKGKKNETNK